MRNDRRRDDRTPDSTASRTDQGGGVGGAERAVGGPPLADGGFQISTLMEALANERRRRVLYYLRKQGTAELEEMTEQVATWETELPPDEFDEQTRQNIRIDLYHAQLPKLEETGIVEFDRRHGSVCFHYPPDPIEQFIEYCATIEFPGMVEGDE